jgi:hypothetical protein
MTLAEIIAAHEAARPTPINRPTAVLTPRGDATAAAYRLKRRLEALGPDDRGIVLALLADLVAAAGATA